MEKEEKSTTQLTVEYIKEHPDIKRCLKKGLINYSSLARLIAKDLSIEKSSSKEAILIAARRFRDTLKKEQGQEKKIRDLLAKSEIELKNKISVFILEKDLNFDFLDEMEKKVRKEDGTFFMLEGSDNYTLITQDKYAGTISMRMKNRVIKHHDNLALINFKSPKDIEEVHGVVAYLTSLFAENNVNIREFFSCWTDTMFIVETNDVQKAITFLKF